MLACGVCSNMNLKWRMIFLTTITFILLVSYKILEPDISHTSVANGDEELEDTAQVVDDFSKDTNEEDKEKGEEKDFASEEEESVTPMNEAQRQAVIAELTAKYLLNYFHPLKDSPWRVAQSIATNRHIHPTNCSELGPILYAMTKTTIKTVNVFRAGTQLKLLLTVEGGQKLIFKPQWYTRDEILTKGPYDGWDRHNGELAAFHIARLFELNRTPLVIGRRLNLKTEILPYATDTLKKTFFTKGNNTCLYGVCHFCKGENTGVCAQGDILEGVIILWLPRNYKLFQISHPWRRTYRSYKARWETDDRYCDTVMAIDMYHHGPRLLDLIDITVLDYLIGNADRHHYETNGVASYNPVIIILDNGKSFGNPYKDEESILAPLYHCCRLRYRTWERLQLLQDGVLTGVLRAILDQDPISPVLSEDHYIALDRRIKGIMEHVQKCINKEGQERVLVRDDRVS